MDKGPIFQFRSTAFPLQPGEDEETNPGVYGKALAEWISGQLGKRGIKTEGVIAEDFGWCVAVSGDEPKIHVACAPGHTENSWQVFAFAERGFLKSLFKPVNTAEPLARVYRELKGMLAENPAIQELRMEDS